MNNQQIEEIKEWLVYDESSSTCLRWKKDKFSGNNKQIKSFSAGDEAGYSTPKGYFNICLNYQQFRVQRVVCVLHDIDVCGLVVDHINQNKKDNRVKNLRAVSISTNNKNRKPNKKSGQLGVFHRKNKVNGIIHESWCAVGSTIDGKSFRKCFAIKKFGEASAFEMAVEARKDFEKEQNKLGDKYILGAA